MCAGEESTTLGSFSCPNLEKMLEQNRKTYIFTAGSGHSDQSLPLGGETFIIFKSMDVGW